MHLWGVDLPTHIVKPEFPIHINNYYSITNKRLSLSCMEELAAIRPSGIHIPVSCAAAAAAHPASAGPPSGWEESPGPLFPAHSRSVTNSPEMFNDLLLLL